MGEQEAKIQRNRKFVIPPELEEAWFVSKGVSWRDYRTMPLHLIEELKAFWYLQNYMDSLDNK